MDSREPVEPRADDALDAELEFHFAETVESLVEQGWSQTAARIEAERRFGNRARYRKDLEKIGRTRQGRRLAMNDVTWRTLRLVRPEALLRDIRFAIRTLIRNPGFTLTALFALTLGIGVNTAVFSVVDSVLLRPLPYGDPDRLVMLFNSRPRLGTVRGSASMLDSVKDSRKVAEVENLEAMAVPVPVPLW
jgi:putative ABC transport system permease protein